MPITAPPVRSPAFRTLSAESAVASTTLLFHGSDGSLWDLTRGTEGVLATTDIAGLGVPDFDRFTADTALPGSTYLGQRTKQRTVTLPVLVSTDVPSDYYVLDAAWWQAMDGLCTLEFARGATSRMLDVRLGAAPGETYRQDPSLQGQQQYTLSLVADQPFYYDKAPTTADARWYANPPAGTFWGGAYGNPFSRLPIADFAGMTLTNPGDVAAWVSWQVYGPCDGVDIGVGDDRVVYSRPIDVGRSVWFVTDPANRSVTLPDGTSVFGGLTRQQFAAVPARTTSLLAPDPINPGTGCRVIASITPRWRRPW